MNFLEEYGIEHKILGVLRIAMGFVFLWPFLDKLFGVTLARVRDFRGLSDKIFDGRANCTIGVKEQIIFPEIDYDKIDKIKGLNISIVTTAKTDVEGFFLLKFLGMPFRSKQGGSGG